MLLIRAVPYITLLNGRSTQICMLYYVTDKISKTYRQTDTKDV